MCFGETMKRKSKIYCFFKSKVKSKLLSYENKEIFFKSALRCSPNIYQRQYPATKISANTAKKDKKFILDLMKRRKQSSADSFPYYICPLLQNFTLHLIYTFRDYCICRSISEKQIKLRNTANEQKDNAIIYISKD